MIPQTGAADAYERLHHWHDALDGYRSARQTWSELRGLKALTPGDAAAITRCEEHIKRLQS